MQRRLEQQIKAIKQQMSGVPRLRHDDRGVLFPACPSTVRAALSHVDVLRLCSAGEQHGVPRGINPAPRDSDAPGSPLLVIHGRPTPPHSPSAALLTAPA